MIRTQISFEKAEYEGARRLAARLGLSLAELCRRGLREALARESHAAGQAPGQPWMRHAGALASGDPGASESIDRVVYDRLEP